MEFERTSMAQFAEIKRLIGAGQTNDEINSGDNIRYVRQVLRCIECYLEHRAHPCFLCQRTIVTLHLDYTQ